MCGLAGLFDGHGRRPFNPALLQRMTDAIAHRGPDGAGAHLEPGLALGHRRLAIIDLAGGAQPMSLHDRSATVVFNGEIYNFRELRAELEAVGARFRTRSDTEVLLHGWRAWGEALLPRLRGMFAFALWDARDETLVLARDQLGKKPLHYAELAEGVLAFGSELKSLLCVAELGRDLEPTAVADFFTFGYVPDPQSIYQGVRKLPAAHLLIAPRGRPPRLRRYWSPLDRLTEGGVSGAAEELRARLDAAVRRRMIADVPLGALLSGGVDSSAVVALMADHSGAPLKTFSIGFGEAAYDERRFAQQVAQRYATEHDTREVSPADFSLVARLPQIYDEPFGDISAIPTFAVCAQARQRVAVALTGDGGDEVLAGYRRHAHHMAAHRVRRRLGPGMRRHLFGPLAAIYPKAAWLPRPMRARSTFRELSLEPADAYARMSCALPPEVREGLLAAPFRQALAGYDPAARVRAAFNVEAPLDPLQRAQYADLMTYLPGDILTKTDRASMANSLELRSPMLDADFAEWAFDLRPEQKLNRRRGGKALLKAALESRLPHEVLYRPKQGFTAPVAAWFRGPLKAQVLALSKSPALQDAGVLDSRAVAALASAHAGGLADHSKALWLVWAFNAFLEHRPPAGLQMT